MPASGLRPAGLSQHLCRRQLRLRPLLTDSGRVTLWVHGHLHHSIDMLRPSGTRILCNPAGPRFSNAAFDESLVVELPT